MINIFLYLGCAIVFITYFLFKIHYGIHMLQQNSYMNDRYFRWAKTNFIRQFRIRELVPFMTVNLVGFRLVKEAIALWIAWYIILILFRPRAIAKIKLKYTDRVKRLYVTGLLVVIAIIVVFALLSTNIALTLALTLPLTLPLTLALAFFVFNVITAFFFLFILLINSINLPIEKAISQWFINDAKKKIKSMQRLKVIGITGSYGKTSTKFILSRILSENFNVLMTPESFNTTLGVTITIRSKLNATHDIFIVEMGAKRSGDIKEICELVSPQYGLITSVGPQHLETFKSIGTIIKTKFELVDALPADGIAFLNMDNEIISSMPVTKDVVGYGINDKSQKYYAEDVNFNMNGMNFKVVKADTGESAVFTTKLLGYHNVSNILAATSVASELGMSMDDIAYAVKCLEPVAHRLEFKKQGDICIIWDAYNSNPEGAKSALEVLKSFDGLKRVLITPGMIELGEQEAELNKEFGKQAGGSCDYIILVGKMRTIPIKEGIIETGFSEQNLYVAKDLKEAMEQMNIVAKKDSVVLFENDLPDSFDE